jgi:hypothetical protein
MLLYLKRIDARSAMLNLWYRKEAVIWLVALVLLALTDPSDHHYTLCPLHNLGWDFCPGCGLGRSVSYFFHMQPEQSFQAHPLGIPAVFLLLYRIVKIFRKPVIV